jgi:hypothetical protein
LKYAAALSPGVGSNVRDAIERVCLEDAEIERWNAVHPSCKKLALRELMATEKYALTLDGTLHALVSM